MVSAVAWLSTPRTSGLEPDWATDRLEGTVAGLALVSGDHTALDLVTGTRVSLGSATGGRPFVGGGLLVVVRGARVDAARLDASRRWTWTAASGSIVTPVATRAGRLLLQACPPASTSGCELVGLDAKGAVAFRIAGATRLPTPSSPALPLVSATEVTGGGYTITDPVSGRQTLQPGGRLTVRADGRVVVVGTQGGKCVVATFEGPDPSSTAVEDSCPAEPLPARATLRTTRHTTPLNPLRWGRPTTVLTVVDTASGRTLGRVTGVGTLEPILFTEDALVVRTEDRIERYTLDR